MGTLIMDVLVIYAIVMIVKNIREDRKNKKREESNKIIEHYDPCQNCEYGKKKHF